MTFEHATGVESDTCSAMVEEVTRDRPLPPFPR